MKHQLTHIRYYGLFAIALFFTTLLAGHAPDQSYIFLRVYEDGIGGRFELNTADLNQALNLELGEEPTLAELRPHLDRIQAYLIENAGFSSEYGDYTIQFAEPDILDIQLGKFLQLPFSLSGVGEIPDALQVQYAALVEEQSSHQGMLVVEYNWKAGIFNNESLVSLVFDSGETTKELSLTEASILKGFWAMVKMGMWHIWIGIDHILFLLALVLPSVVRRRPEEGTGIEAEAGLSTYSMAVVSNAAANWVPVERFRPAFIYVLKIITLFTVAHTITLSLAAFEVIVLPSRLVESIIALSIALAAYHNIRPLFTNDVWIIAFGFGLFHGFGFANVLGEIGTSGEFMTLTLFGFNLGVEIGQVLVICLIFPVLFFFRKSKAYPKFLIYSSVALILIALYWFVERFFGISGAAAIRKIFG